MVRTGCHCGVGHLADRYQVGCGWGNYQAVLGHAFGDDGVGRLPKLIQNSLAKTLVGFPVSILEEQWSESVVGLVVGRNEFNDLREVWPARGDLRFLIFDLQFGNVPLTRSLPISLPGSAGVLAGRLLVRQQSGT